jgi:sec-independent protein translocase protein TatC
MQRAADQLFIHHVLELRRRLLFSLLAAMSASGIAYLYKDRIAEVFAQPIHQSLIYTAPSGGLQFIIQICLTVGVILTLPIFVYNLIQFIAPAFEGMKLRRLRVLFIILASYCLALLGLAFAYLLVLPMSFHFFSSFQVGGIKALISTSEYFSFVLGCLLAFAAIFQLPLLLVCYNKINRFPPGTLTKYRRFVVVGSLAVALVLPFTYDPLTQFVIAVPIIVLYELSVFLIWASNRRYRKQQKKLQKQAQQAVRSPKLQAQIIDQSGQVARPMTQSLQHSRPTQPGRRLDRRRPLQLG